MNKKIYEMVTKKIVNQLEVAIANGESFHWIKPWNGGVRYATSWNTNKTYRGINALLLEPDEYITFNQIQEHNGKLKKGSKSSFVVHYNFVEQKKKNENGEEKIVSVFKGLRYYNVFPLKDVEGIERRNPFKEINNEEKSQHMRDADDVVKQYFKKENIEFSEGENARAFFRPSTNSITLPKRECFTDNYSYYETLFHETIHSTGPILKRDMGNSLWEHTKYSFEELVAEIGANMLCNIFCIENDKDINNNNCCAYLKGWLKPLNNDVTMIVKAASAAQKACDYILGNNYQDDENIA